MLRPHRRHRMWLPKKKESQSDFSSDAWLRCSVGRLRLRGQLQSWHLERGRSFITVEIFIQILRSVGDSKLDRIRANVIYGISFSHRRDNNEAVVLVDVHLCY